MKKRILQMGAGLAGLMVLLSCTITVLATEPAGSIGVSTVLPVAVTSVSVPQAAEAAPVRSEVASAQPAEPEQAAPEQAAPAAQPQGQAEGQQLLPMIVNLITPDNLRPLIPDEALRVVVFDAVVASAGNNTNMLQGADFEEVLAKFVGTVDATNKNIYDVSGLQYLVHAEKIILSNNKISDWKVLSPSGIFSNTHYGYGVNETPSGDAQNVQWVIDRNPYTQLPEGFGGRLVIEQMASHAYTYPQDVAPVPYQFVRSTAGQSFQLVVDVARCRIGGNKAEDNDGVPNGFVKLLQNAHNFVALQKGSTQADPTVQYTVQQNTGPELNRYVTLAGIVKNGETRLGIGTAQVFHYETTGELGTITPGSQSFKYYLHQKMTVYDRVSLTSSNYTGGVSFTKTDATTGKPLAGAVYSLFLGQQEVQTGLVTGADGKIAVSNLQPGSYTFRETKAPEGYQLTTQPAPFVLQAGVEISGGYSTATASDGTTATAGDHEVLLAGAGTPDVVITPVGTGGNGATATVVYSSLNGSTTAETRSFTSIAAAQADVNAEKNANKITGPVTINVRYAGGMNETATAAQTNQPTPSSSSSSQPPSSSSQPSSSSSSSQPPSSSSSSSSSQQPPSSSQSSTTSSSSSPQGLAPSSAGGAPGGTTPTSPQTGDGTPLPFGFIMLGVACLAGATCLLGRRMWLAGQKKG